VIRLAVLKRPSDTPGGTIVKCAEEAMKILAAFDLTGSARAAADLAGCSHHTMTRLVAERDAAGDRPPRTSRTFMIEPHFAKIEEWVEASKGKIRADVAHNKLQDLGFTAWLAWSRFRIVIALRGRTIPSVFAALDATFRLVGGVPTYPQVRPSGDGPRVHQLVGHEPDGPGQKHPGSDRGLGGDVPGGACGP
jgi:hypothetical protein